MSDTATEAIEAPVPQAVGPKRAMPTYPLRKVAELPDDAPVGRTNFYLGLLSKITDDPGSWYEIAYFQTPSGAANAVKALESGDREIPTGEWEFEARKVENPANPIGAKHSSLYARFMG